MKKLLLIVGIMVVFTVSASAQATCKQDGGTAECVLVPSELLDKANLAFQEVVALRLALDAKNETIKAKNEAIAQAEARRAAEVAGKDAVIEAKEDTIKKLAATKCNISKFSFKPLGWSLFKTETKRCYLDEEEMD